MSSVSTPIKAFTPRKRLETDRLESLRAKIVKESSNLYKLPTNPSSITPVSPTKAFEQSRFNTIPISSPSLKQEELNREHVRASSGRSKLGYNNNDSLPSIEWEHPDLSKIEKRIVNKELETKKVMVNIILLLSSNLIYNFIELVWKKFNDFLENSIIINFNFKNLLIGIQILFLWNIINGLYKVFKPQDQFTDLSLTPHQRQLLGLPQVSTTNTSFEVIKPTRITTGATTTTTTIKNPELKHSPIKKISTPIASPMASPSKSFSPRKSSTASSPIKQPTTTTTTEPRGLTQLKRQELTATPTYIPSPKYYYRMDSPSRTRRRI